LTEFYRQFILVGKFELPTNFHILTIDEKIRL